MMRIYLAICIGAVLALFVPASGWAMTFEGDLPYDGDSALIGPDGRMWLFSADCVPDRTIVKLCKQAAFQNADAIRVIGVGGNVNDAACALAPDASVWAVPRIDLDRVSPWVYRVAANQKSRRFELPNGDAAIALAAGSDGRMWALVKKDRILKIDTKGHADSISIVGGRALREIVQGPDGAIWAAGGSLVVRIPMRGKIQRFHLNRHSKADIAFGPDGNLWLADRRRFVVLSASGKAKSVSLQMPNGQLPGLDSARSVLSIAQMANGSLAFTAGVPTLAHGGGGYIDQPSIGVVDQQGHVVETAPDPAKYVMPYQDDTSDATAGFQMIIAGFDGKLWMSHTGPPFDGPSIFAPDPLVVPIPAQPSLAHVSLNRRGNLMADIRCDGVAGKVCAGNVVLTVDGGTWASTRYSLAPGNRFVLRRRVGAGPNVHVGSVSVSSVDYPSGAQVTQLRNLVANG